MSTLADHVIVDTVFQRTTALAKDLVVVSMHFKKKTASTFADAATELGTLLISFWNDVPTDGTQRVGEYLSSAISRSSGATKINCYDGSIAPGSRTPATTAFTLVGFGDGQPLPSEVALCLSQRSFFVLFPFKNQRGRQYIGPLNKLAVQSSQVDGDCRPTSTIIGDLTKAAVTLAQDVADSTHIESWCIYSGKLNVLFPAQEAFVDNAFDTQRRRGAAATLRTVRTLP